MGGLPGRGTGTAGGTVRAEPTSFVPRQEEIFGPTVQLKMGTAPRPHLPAEQAGLPAISSAPSGCSGCPHPPAVPSVGPALTSPHCAHVDPQLHSHVFPCSCCPLSALCMPQVCQQLPDPQLFLLESWQLPRASSSHPRSLGGSALVAPGISILHAWRGDEVTSPWHCHLGALHHPTPGSAPQHPSTLGTPPVSQPRRPQMTGRWGNSSAAMCPAPASMLSRDKCHRSPGGRRPPGPAQGSNGCCGEVTEPTRRDKASRPPATSSASPAPAGGDFTAVTADLCPGQRLPAP